MFLEARTNYYKHMWLTTAYAYTLARRDYEHSTIQAQEEWMDYEWWFYYEKPHSYIVIKPLFDAISKLDPETLHASYVSLLAQHEQEQAMASIKRVKQAKESYYQKYGRWYDKFISYLK